MVTNKKSEEIEEIIDEGHKYVWRNANSADYKILQERNEF